MYFNNQKKKNQPPSEQSILSSSYRAISQSRARQHSTITPNKSIQSSTTALQHDIEQVYTIEHDSTAARHRTSLYSRARQHCSTTMNKSIQSSTTTLQHGTTVYKIAPEIAAALLMVAHFLNDATRKSWYIILLYYKY